MNIQIDNISLQIGEKKILESISFNFQESSLTKIVGENGSGKTSLLNCILGIYNGYDGIVKFNDQIIDNENQRFYNQKISFLINQKMCYPNLTVEENIQIFKYYYQAKELDPYLTELVGNFDFSKFLKIKAKKLSEGFQKKLNIILSLINNGDVIILDEPFNFLDQKAEDSLTNYLKNCLDSGRTILVTAHQKHVLNDIPHQTLAM